MTWQDPVALGLVITIMALSLSWRRRLLTKGETSCGKCPSQAQSERASSPMRVELSKLRLNQHRTKH